VIASPGQRLPRTAPDEVALKLGKDHPMCGDTMQNKAPTPRLDETHSVLAR
jgi:hypothetical protein